MEEKISLEKMDDEKGEEMQPLNVVGTKNMKEIIVPKVYNETVKTTTANKRKERLLPVVRQYLAGGTLALSQLVCGMAAGFSAVLLPQLQAEDSDIVITEEEGSWIASLLALPLMIGCLFSGSLLNRLGRKSCVYISSAGLGIGWFITALAPNVPALYAGRFITGFCISLSTPPVQVYLAETSQPEHRGILLSSSPLAVSSGVMISHLLGTFLSWRVAAWLCTLPVIMCIAFLPFFKESPVWLLQKGRDREAEESFTWFRGHSEKVMKEFKALKNSERTGRKENETLSSKLKNVLKPTFMKPLLILMFFFFTQQFSGVNAVTFYSVHILKKVLTNVNEYFSTLLIDVIRTITSIVAVILLKSYGKKQITIISSVGTSISLFLLSLYLACVSDDSDDPLSSPPSNHSSPLSNFSNETTTPDQLPSDSVYSEIVGYFPLIFLILYVCFVTLGLVPLPWVISGELFSKDMRGIGAGVTSSFGFLCFFIVVKSTPQLFEGLKDYGTFCLFGVVALVGSIVLFLFLPETKDKTLLEIEAFFDKKKRTANALP
ncbi:hypothetical protein RUM43_001003 [Polyplax serrata]|uniref:Major facilitator superfamily (MFS) profile domain-containing protein n=1 Tax=Polyplax serrata TaxID=468196 RepID=A0AAN8SEP2_POLSC